MGMLSVHLEPRISGGLLDRAATEIDRSSSFQIRRWSNLDAGKHGLEGCTLTIDGLPQTLTDVLVSVTLIDGTSSQHILRPQAPSMTLHLTGTGLAVSAYLKLGIEHILTGIDHLMFVLGLILLVRSRSMLVKTITAFTLAHSITLAGTALHLITVNPALIEALVALSILFVAVEVVHSYRGQNGLTVRFPWLIAFTFGLLHGCAFAGALVQIGLPANAIPLSLLLFNIGVEIGQLLFIALVLAIGWAWMRLRNPISSWPRWIPPYAIGSFAAMWLLERVSAAFS